MVTNANKTIEINKCLTADFFCRKVVVPSFSKIKAIQLCFSQYQREYLRNKRASIFRLKTINTY